MRKQINSFEELEKIGAELKKLRETPIKYESSKEEKELNERSHDSYKRILAQVLSDGGWTSL